MTAPTPLPVGRCDRCDRHRPLHHGWLCTACRDGARKAERDDMAAGARKGWAA